LNQHRIFRQDKWKRLELRALQLQAATRAEQAENLADNAHRNDNRDTDGNGPYLEHFAQLLSQRNYVNDMGNDLDEVRLRGLPLPNAGTATRLHAWGSGACSVVSPSCYTICITHVILAMREPWSRSNASPSPLMSRACC